MFAPEKNFGANFCCDSGKLISVSNTVSVLFFGYYIKREKERARLQVERQDVVLPEKKPFRATSESGEIFFPHFTRGLRHHRYFCVALRGLFIRKNDVLVVQVQEGIYQEVNHPISP